jgi:hypothetical protein
MSRFLCASIFMAMIVSCSPKEGPKPQASAPPGTPAVKAPAGVPAVDKAIAGAKVGTTPDTAAIKEAAEAAAKDATATAKETVDAAKEAAGQIPEVGAVLESGFSIDKLKTSLGSFSVDGLKDLASKLGEAVQNQGGVVKGIQEQIAKFGLTDPSKIAELKKSLESSTGVLKELKDKLQLVVTKLKESGIDVSKYTSLLGG